MGFEFVSMLLIIAAPLASFAGNGLLRDRYSWISSLLSLLLLLTSAIVSVILALTFSGDTTFEVPWFHVGSVSLSFSARISQVSTLMLMVVNVVSLLVHLYSLGYMAGDRDIRKYFSVLGFFTFSMNMLVLADNILMLFFFWELVGFSSYLLIGHYRERPEAGQAARKAFIVNRIGDALFIIGLMIIWANAGTFDISQLKMLEPQPWFIAASLCLFGGVAGKSAQFPLFTWLPDAMEGPTPVSALIHAATMVAAGIFLLIRLRELFIFSGYIVALVGLATAVVGAFAAIWQNDIKRVLAYSTISQLGLMVMCFGAGFHTQALLHLFTHAFFKAGLFLAAGSIIHTLHQASHEAKIEFDVQDIRLLGGLRNYLPKTFIVFIITGAALVGLPLTSGFVSKEVMLNALWFSDHDLHMLFVVGFMSTSLLTAIYITRTIKLIFFGASRWGTNLNIRESPPVMQVSMMATACLSIFIIFSLNPFHYSGQWHEVHGASSWIVGIISIVISATGIYIGIIASRRVAHQQLTFQQVFFFDRITTNVAVKSSEALSEFVMLIDRRILDRALHTGTLVTVTFAHVISWFDRFVVDGLVRFAAYLMRVVGNFTRSFQSGKIQRYIFWAIFTIIIFLIWKLLLSNKG